MATRMFRCFLLFSRKQQKTSKHSCGHFRSTCPIRFFAGCQNWYLFAWCLLFPRKHQKTSKHSRGHFRLTCPISFLLVAARTGICSLGFCCFHEDTRKHRNTRAATFVQPVRSVSRGLRPELAFVRLFSAVSTKTPENMKTLARPLSFNLSGPFLAGCGQNWYLFAWFLLPTRKQQKHRNIRAATFVQPVRSVSRGLRPELVVVRLFSAVTTKTAENIESLVRPLSFNLSDPFLADCGPNWYLFACFLLLSRKQQETSKHSRGHFRSTCPIRFSRVAARTGSCSLVFRFGCSSNVNDS